MTHRPSGPDTIEVWAAGQRQQVLQLQGQAVHDPVYSPTGHVLFTRRPGNAGLWAVPFSLERLRATGDPFLVMPGVAWPSISRTASLVYVPDVEMRPSRLVWVDREGQVLGRMEPSRVMDPTPALSPDGTRAAAAVRTDGKWDIWNIELKTGASTQVTSDGTARRPSWSPDGTSIVYDSGSAAAPGGVTTVVKRAAADGSGELNEYGPGRDGVISHDGQQVLYQRDFDVFSRPVGGGAEAGVLTGPSNDASPRPSPDGRFLAFVTVTSAYFRVTVAPLPVGVERTEVAIPHSGGPRWSRDGRRLFVSTPVDVHQVDVHTEPRLRLGIPRKLFDRTPGAAGSQAPFDVSADGERFLMVEADKSVTPNRSMVVVLNFTPGGVAAKR